MFFVGRHQEITRIEASLAAGRNVILRGKYGIGRTALLRQVASRNAGRWAFVFTDFSANGTVVCKSVLKQLLGHSVNDLNARQLARAVAAYRPRRGRKTILVLDDVAKLTHPKLDLLRRLRTSPHLQFGAIAERFVSEDDVMRIRVVLDPATVVALDYLDDPSSVEFFSYHARRLGLGWTETDIEMLARAMHGYPLEMAQLISREQRKVSRGVR